MDVPNQLHNQYNFRYEKYKLFCRFRKTKL